MIVDALFAVGLLLTTAYQIRAAGFPLGPGEVLILLWLARTLARVAVRRERMLPRALTRLMLFWILFAAAQSVGYLTTLVTGDRYEARWMLHDAAAYLLLAVVSCSTLAVRDAWPRMNRVAWLLVGFATPVLGLLLAQGFELIDIPFIEPWYWDRFRGWAAIPNQLAVFCVALCFLAIHLAESAPRLPAKIAALAFTVTPLWVGWLTKSNGFRLAVAVGGVLFVALKARAWFTSTAPLTTRRAIASMAVLALPLFFVSLAQFAPPAERLAHEAARDEREVDGDAALRFELWRAAWNRSLGVGMLGLGPGPHLEIPPSLALGHSADGPKNIEHPEPGDAPNYEAHNTALDLLVQSGLMGLLSFIWLLATALWAASSARLAALPAALIGIVTFGTFHLAIRQPILWVSIALCLLAKAGPEITPPANTG